jgi:hypothetical protein
MGLDLGGSGSGRGGGDAILTHAYVRTRHDGKGGGATAIKDDEPQYGIYGVRRKAVHDKQSSVKITWLNK